MSDDHPLLRIEHVSRTFSMRRASLHAVSDVSLALRRGEILGVLGESGCGKSTLARMVVGSLPVSSGALILNEFDYTHIRGRAKRDFRRNIQMVFQDPLSSFSPRMKIGAYLCEPRVNFDRISKRQALREAEEMLEQVGLPREFLCRYPHELSGGQLQRVAIARALAISPALLLCDEATGALDVSIQDQVAKLLVRLVAERNMGCIFIGHDPALVRCVTHRIAVMYLGRIVELLPSEALGDACRHPYTQALLQSIFDVYCDPQKPIRLLRGEPPSPMEIGRGCPFAPRCDRRMPRCEQEPPRLEAIGPEHSVACHLYA